MNARDIDTIHSFYVSNRQQLYTYALSIVGNREGAEDAIHGVFERLLGGDGLPTELRPYVYRAIRNAAYDGHRRNKVRVDSIFQLAADVNVDSAKAPQSSGLDDVELLLRHLSEDERETIVLKLYSGFTLQQIATLRGTALPTVASWYQRGLKRLKNLLAEEH